MKQLAVCMRQRCGQLLDWLRTSESDAAGSQALQTYLGSDRINNRTDDDKSLLMAISNF